VNDRFRRRVAIDRDEEVDVAGEPRLGSDRDRQATDERERKPTVVGFEEPA
jgi:hypothetical protein